MGNEKLNITVLNWRKFNPRTDRKKHTWFRMENSIATDPQFAHFTAEEMWTWTTLLAYASTKSEAGEEDVAFVLPLIALARHCRVAPEMVLSAVEKLTELGCIAISSSHNRMVTERSPTGYRPVTERSPVATDWDGLDRNGVPTDGRTDGRTNGEEARACADVRARETINEDQADLVSVDVEESEEEEVVSVQSIADSETEKEASAQEASDACGPVAELSDLPGLEEGLADILQRAQRAWINAFGEHLVKTTVPLALAHWDSSGKEDEGKSKASHIFRWLQNAKSGRFERMPPVMSARAGPRSNQAAPLKNTGKSCARSVFPNICQTHKLDEVCEIEGRHRTG